MIEQFVNEFRKMSDTVWRVSIIVLLACIVFVMVLFVREFRNYNKNLQITAMPVLQGSLFRAFPANYFPTNHPNRFENEKVREEIAKIQSAMRQHITNTWN